MPAPRNGTARTPATPRCKQRGTWQRGQLAGRKRAARLRSGGWCLAALKPGGAGVRSVHLPGGHDYLLAEPHAPADGIIVDVLVGAKG